METINNIPSGKYDGYYWMSDSKKPEVLANAYIPDILSKPDASKNPFVIEAQLYDKDNKISYSLKYVDGKYILKKYILANQSTGNESKKDNSCYTRKQYFANRMPGKKLIFRQYWRDTEDTLCGGMPVLQPAELVFVGFEPIETKRNG